MCCANVCILRNGCCPFLSFSGSDLRLPCVLAFRKPLPVDSILPNSVKHLLVRDLIYLVKFLSQIGYRCCGCSCVHFVCCVRCRERPASSLHRTNCSWLRPLQTGERSSPDTSCDTTHHNHRTQSGGRPKDAPAFCTRTLSPVFLAFFSFDFHSF